jgi:hypothetical protein
MMAITARFPGRCRNCGGRISQGDKINWNRDGGATHISCDDGGGHSCIGCGIDAGDQMMHASLGLSCPDCYADLTWIHG